MTRPKPTPPKDKPPEIIATVGALRNWLQQFPANAKVCALAEYADASMSITIGNKELGSCKFTGY